MPPDRSNDAPREHRVVFVFAHQDDESGVFPLIDQVISDGGRAICLYLTAGVPRGRSATRRNEESLAVLRRLGVATEDVHFIGEKKGIPDQQLYLHLEAAYQSVSEIVACHAPVDELIVLAWEGGHPDHDAAHLVAVAVARKLRLLDRTRQFALYNGCGLPWILFRVLSPLRENGPVTSFSIAWRKRLTFVTHCLRYPSQLKTWVGLFPFMSLDLILAGVQRLQSVRAERLLSKPHTGALLYDRRKSLAYDRFREVVTPFVEKYIIGSDAT